MTTTIEGSYGEAPVAVASRDLDWDEFMSWLYLPINIPEAGYAFPAQLRFAQGLVHRAWTDCVVNYPHLREPYVYVTAKRGWAEAPGALNRPGWHTDGFGTDDINYVWWDGDNGTMGTEFAVHEFAGIEQDDAMSLVQFEQQARLNLLAEPRLLYRLTPYVVHRAPMHFTPGMRSFLKISFSNHRYNLIGNSHNHLIDYQWPMFPRDMARNDPTRAADFVEET